MRVFGNDFEEVDKIEAGDIAVASGLKHTKTGDTLISLDAEKNAKNSKGKGGGVGKLSSMESGLLTLAGISVPEPVFFCSIEAESSSHEKDLVVALERLMIEDPSLSVDFDDDSKRHVTNPLILQQIEMQKQLEDLGDGSGIHMYTCIYVYLFIHLLV